MSIYSDYKVGALSDFEFEQACRVMNRIDRYEREYIDEWERLAEEAEDEEDEE